MVAVTLLSVVLTLESTKMRAMDRREIARQP